MKQVCLACDRVSPDKNLFCQETYCPAEMAPTILDYGEWLGDIEIIKPIIILRSSVLYEATHQKTKVLLKVAHPGAEHKERLEREAEFLQTLQKTKEPPKTLPRLLPPYANTTVDVDPYGRMMLQGHLLYFCLFEHFDGEPLRDVLIKNPQLWINHIGWITISLAAAINLLHLEGLYHFGLNPSCVLVRFDKQQNIPRVLLFDLGIASHKNHIGDAWYPSFVPPAYTAPELIGGDGMRGQYLSGDYRTDVYGVGLVLYEMLVGEPTYRYKLRSDDEVYELVRRDRRVKMNRVEDVQRVAEIALETTQSEIARRPQLIADIGERMVSIFGEVPPEKKSRFPTLRTILWGIAVLLAIAFLVIIAVYLNEIG